MSNILPLITAYAGLNTRVDPIRIGYDPSVGVSDLGVGMNITIDDSGRASLCDGFVELYSGDYHSGFGDGGDYGLVVSGDSLYRVDYDETTTSIRSGLTPGLHMSYARTPAGIFYANGTENGLVVNGQSSSWPVDVYTGRDTNRKYFSAPVGNHLSYFNSRVYIAQDDVLWWSRPWAYGRYRLAGDYWQFPHRIVMVLAVSGGLFVSDENNIYFLQGENPDKGFKEIKLTNHPAIEWCFSYKMVDPKDMKIDAHGLCVIFASTNGVYVGTSDGILIPRNGSKVVYPSTVTRGAGLLYGHNFIHTMY